MGLPQINIEFSGKAVSAVERSARGIVALILKDATGTFDVKEYRSIEEIKVEDWTPANIDYIKKAFMGTPAKVICERLDTAESDYSEVLTRLGFKKWNYLAIPDLENATDIETWLKGKRENGKKTFKAVLPNASTGDHEGIINFTTTDIKVGDKTYTTAEYCCRIAGVLAGLPFTRSATYYVLPEVEGITESTTPDSDIESGKLILVNDGEKIKIGRAVNSLVSTTVSKTEDFKKIKIVEVMDMVKDDIRDTFNNNYIGKVNNIYDNQVLFFTSVNAYFKGLAGDEIFDRNFQNKADVDVEAQRLAWEGIGTDVSQLSDQEVKEKSFRSNVYAKANVKIVDAMEDLDFSIAI
ncbi:phage-like element pbsx protein XkdK [Alkaliphilus metalliredigens QYMF]|uniref:Phage-like element pbsx protein XkdK n=1 Tax=Alkaliphilus metalliredigens (strain QYMF) TaxID=293826 RepID=A6TQV6_ALKMQ|nr:phage tail sheath C-terminal domain-containing protein [Alkaliphilus metalliredigens]ABR48574.1 phage-like element pbsx protein XkdK [Alkaliphilus metalliredigens QYMF]